MVWFSLTNDEKKISAVKNGKTALRNTGLRSLSFFREVMKESVSGREALPIKRACFLWAKVMFVPNFNLRENKKCRFSQKTDEMCRQSFFDFQKTSCFANLAPETSSPSSAIRQKNE